MSSAIWNLTSPLRSGYVHLLGSGREMYGTVIKQGKINKTIKVRVDYQYWNRMYAKYFTRSSDYLVHDEDNYCREGDKVVIKSSPQLSKLKHYYVRNIVKQFPRTNSFIKSDAPNLELNENIQKIYQNFLLKEKQRKTFINKKQEGDFKSSAKARAMHQAIQNLKKSEKNQEKEKGKKEGSFEKDDKE